jgi:entry exclusion lipoprotein TrbK
MKGDSMIVRVALAAAVAASFLIAAPASAATPEQKKETCEFGANDQKLTGAKRKAFMAKCMSNKDSPRGKPMPAPKQQ